VISYLILIEQINAHFNIYSKVKWLKGIRGIFRA